MENNAMERLIKSSSEAPREYNIDEQYNSAVESDDEMFSKMSPASLKALQNKKQPESKPENKPEERKEKVETAKIEKVERKPTRKKRTTKKSKATDDFIQMLALELLDTCRDSGISIRGFDMNQIKVLYDYIEEQIN